MLKHIARLAHTSSARILQSSRSALPVSLIALIDGPECVCVCVCVRACSVFPVGVLYDLFSTQLDTAGTPGPLPWCLCVHYTHAPPESSASWLSSLPPQTLFMNSLKVRIAMHTHIRVHIHIHTHACVQLSAEPGRFSYTPTQSVQWRRVRPALCARPN